MLGRAQIARAVAWNWAMICLTRPIDTLVITVRDAETEPSRLLYSVAGALPDIVEIL